jgi:hypothetical protein
MGLVDDGLTLSVVVTRPFQVPVARKTKRDRGVHFLCDYWQRVLLIDPRRIQRDL